MEITEIILYSLIGVVVLTLIVCLAIANFAGENLITIYNKYSKRTVDFNNTLNFADVVSKQEFNGKIKTNVIQGYLNDFYYNGTISLSQGVAYASNVSAFAVCAHELGHAIQYRDNPKKMSKFASKLVLSKILSKLTMPLFLAGIICIFFNIIVAICFLVVAFLTFMIGLVAKLSTIKVEKEASMNALTLLSKYAYFDEEDIKCAKKVLSAAKLTYVASFLRSVLAWTFLVRKYDFY